ncbi:MAG: tetratricopeptide repeat protein [Aggregatilineales bacterium]
MNTHDIDALWNYNDPVASETRFRELLPDAENGDDKGYLVEVLTQIARAQGLQAHFDDAHSTLNQAESLLTPELARATVRYLLELGRVLNSSGDKAQALPFFMEAWETAQYANEDFYAVDAAHMIAIVKEGKDALNWHMKAIAYAEASSQPRARNWLGSLYNNIGWTYFDMGDYSAALDIFRKALVFREEKSNVETIRITRWCIAKVLRVMGRVDEALTTQQALFAEYEADGEESGYTDEELGECLLALGRADEAPPHFARAYATLSKDIWLVKNEAERLARLKQLGGL